jgi:hypothetical protein
VENVVMVTLDGFRHQEFFAGADATTMPRSLPGVYPAGENRSAR